MKNKTIFLLVIITICFCCLPLKSQLNCSGGIFNCSTGLTFDGTLLTVGAATNIKGSSTNNSATAGNIGEYISSTISSGSAVTDATGSASPITSISLTAGDWEVGGVVDYVPNSATSVTLLTQGVQTLNNCMTVPAIGAQDTFTQWETAANIIGASNPAWAVPTQRVSLSSTTSVCLITKPSFSVNSLTSYGTIWARRMR